VHDTTTRATTVLSVALREGTRAEHAAAEGTAFVDDLLSGRLDVTAYIDLAVQQQAIYAALEAAGTELARHDTRALPVVMDELQRVPAIDADLRHLLGATRHPGGTRQPRVLAATREYAAHLRTTAADLTRWVAHAYTRYLGDLSGGQVIYRALQRHYGLADAGLSFYRFPERGGVKALRDLYRERLDALPLSREEHADVVAEARLAFAANRAMLAALGETHRPSLRAAPRR
jgi:heme oxygenase